MIQKYTVEKKVLKCELLQSETEIMKSWKGDKSIPLVSICSITYNQEPFIEQAIQGFLMQETDFAFEVLISDDCSTDKTAKIIATFALAYPHIIKANLREENVGMEVNGIENFQRAKGKYIALCEGDDYWIDSLKIQKQVDIFELDEKVSLCFHPSEQVDISTGRTTVLGNHFVSDGEVPLENIILGRGHYMPTASLMFRNRQQTKLLEILQGKPVGDYFIQVYMASLGRTFFLHDIMCVYRVNTASSWTLKSGDLSFRKNHCKEMVIAIDDLVQYISGEEEKWTLYQVMRVYTRCYIGEIVGLWNKLRSLRQLSRKLQHYDSWALVIGTIKDIGLSIWKRVVIT